MTKYLKNTWYVTHFSPWNNGPWPGRAIIWAFSVVHSFTLPFWAFLMIGKSLVFRPIPSKRVPFLSMHVIHWKPCTQSQLNMTILLLLRFHNTTIYWTVFIHINYTNLFGPSELWVHVRVHQVFQYEISVLIFPILFSLPKIKLVINLYSMFQVFGIVAFDSK